MAPLEIELFEKWAKDKKDWSTQDYVTLCQEAVKLAKKYPQHRPGLMYWLVERGRHFGDFDTEDADPVRGQVRDLAADLELPDGHVDTSDGLSINQKLELLEDLITRMVSGPQ